MKILLIGSGGREHALAWRLAQSPRVTEVVVAPGNAGTAREHKCRNIDIPVTDIDALLAFAQAENVAFTLVGPEAPLVLGVVDLFQEHGLRIFGPRRAAAQLEGSKAFAKDFLARHNIPTAHYAVFENENEALQHLQQVGAPIVIKADGLAAGKGVIVAMTLAEAREAITDMLGNNQFGAAGARVVIEEFLVGEEASFISMVDGRTALPMATSQDHKRVFDGDTGPNTGGMGAYSPAPVVDELMTQRIMDTIIAPTLAGMRSDGRPYQGFLYAGVMIDSAGLPRVLEFNCRMGDPETQPIMMRLKTDIVAACLDLLTGRGANVRLEFDSRATVGVVLAAGGYPNDYNKGAVIQGLSANDGQSKVFHAGTQTAGSDCLTNGGRVLCVVGLGARVSDAQAAAYARVDRITWDGMFCRRDIGYRAVARERKT